MIVQDIYKTINERFGFSNDYICSGTAKDFNTFIGKFKEGSIIFYINEAEDQTTFSVKPTATYNANYNVLIACYKLDSSVETDELQDKSRALRLECTDYLLNIVHDLLLKRYELQSPVQNIPSIKDLNLQSGASIRVQLSKLTEKINYLDINCQ